MDPIIAAAAISAAAQGANALSTGNMNRKNREWSETMYQRQYDDNLTMWNLQNEYNDPSAQMQRLDDAGLNPHLIYGSGAGASTPASPIKSVDIQRHQNRAHDYSGFSNIGRSLIHDIADIDIKQAQADNVKADTTNKIKQGMLYDIDTKQRKYNYKFEKKLESINADIRRQTLLDSRAKTKYTLAKNEREAAMNAQNLQKGLEEILLIRLNQANTNAQRQKIKAEIQGIKKSTELKQLEIDLKQMGIEKGDPWYFRVLARLGLSSDLIKGARKKAIPSGYRN